MKLDAAEGIGTGHSHIIRRPRLTRLLDETSARIILLVAPAGYGKTTLAREWLSDRPHVWYSGTLATADIAALALGIANACSTVSPGAGDRLKAHLRISRAPTQEVERLANLLAEDLREWPQGAWIGFDDYQFACDSEPAERFVEHLLQSCGVQLLATSRSRPRWATARRMIYGEIYEIGRNLLAMNRDEAGQVLHDAKVDDPDVLLSLADGWPALIGLAALSPAASMPGETVPDELYGFFAEELYQAVPSEIRQAFRRLALSPYVTLDIAEAVVGERAGETLDQGVEFGFFASSPRDRLELHPLLRPFLASKFRRRQDDPTGQLVTELVDMLIGLEEWDDVFSLALRFRDKRALIKLFEASLAQMLDQARLPTLANWIAAATSRGVDSPLIDLADAELAFRQGDLRRAEALACQAARRFEKVHPLTSKAFWIAGSSAHLMFRDEASLDYFKAAETTSSSASDTWQALWGQFLASETMERETDAAELLSRLARLSGSTVDELLRIATGHFRMAQLCGSIGTALASNEELIHLASRSKDPLVRSSFLNSYGSMLVLSGKYERALREGEAEIAFALASSLDFVLPFAHFLVATSCLGLRRFRDCKAHLAICERIEMKSDFITSNMSILHARLRLTAQQPREAVAILERGYPLAKTCHPAHAEYLAWWSLAHAVAGNAATANELSARAEMMSRRIEVAALVPWTSAILAAHGETAHDATNEAFSIAVQSGNVDAFVTAYRACPRVLELLSFESRNRDQLEPILERAHDHSLAKRFGLDVSSQPTIGASTVLTKREHEVIELVSQGLTNKEIGRTLYITEGTVKKHVRNASTKLGVRSRTEAAMRVAELSG